MVEDEMLVSMLIEDMLIDMGYVVVGPAARVDEALALIRSASIDLAVLDVNLAGELSFPVADELDRQGIPYIFATGYGSRGLSDTMRAKRALRKPFAASELKAALAHLD